MGFIPLKRNNFSLMTTMSSYGDLIQEFSGKNILVLGDVMIDAYLFGRVDRISPEAPVPVVSLHKRENRLGGAANVALNIQTLGGRPFLCSVIGNDRQGEIFFHLMKESNLETKGIISSNSRITTTKFRVIGNNTQMLRVDEEHLHDLTNTEEDKYIEKVHLLLQEEKIETVVFQDYNKGILTPFFINQVIKLANEKHIPVCVDPKRKNFETYKGVTLFKPNLKELKEGLKMDFDQQDPVQLEAAVSVLQGRQDIGMMLVTLSEEGVMIRSKSGPDEFTVHHIPAHRRSITDVSGAGDSVISVAALCLACGCEPEQLATLANLAGGLVCEEVGVVPVNKERLLRESLQL